MTFLAILQAEKLRLQEGSDLRETLESQWEAQPPQRDTTHPRCFVRVQFRGTGTRPVSALLTFSDLAPTRGTAVVSLIHSANFLQDSMVNIEPSSVLGSTGAQGDLSPGPVSQRAPAPEDLLPLVTQPNLTLCNRLNCSRQVSQSGGFSTQEH